MTEKKQQKYSDGSVYDGDWSSGERHGRGSLTYANKTQYTGEFQRGLHSGCGIMIIPDSADKYVPYVLAASLTVASVIYRVAPEKVTARLSLNCNQHPSLGLDLIRQI